MLDFENRLQTATELIGSIYFQLPVYDQEDPIYRERAYCYELYHQLRINWPESSYFLSGEVDKSRHPVIRGNDLDNTKPDFLIHVPADMDNNFGVIEVKPITGRQKGIDKDIRTMLAYLEHGNYERAFYLLYGRTSDGNALDRAQSMLIKMNVQNSIELWHHSAPNTAASRIIL